ncbi:MAG: O-antigen ligase family protein [Lentisphaeria bacterium]|jgi:tetratricopeptide (TPR) repeat protein|nr:O-antigen ligase family protein [Lentisphaeria bacterium]MDP7740384.1 O-antigen ligase family protein [Lentisphaeria bacterium]
MVELHRRLGTFYLVAFAVVVFLGYPLAIVPSLSFFPEALRTLAFHFAVPSQFILSVLALPIVFGSPHLPRRMPLVAMLGFAGSVIISFVLQPQHGQQAVELLGQVLIPLAVATAVKATGLRVERITAYGFSLWFVYILTGLVSVLNGSEIVGLSGNRNWAGSMYLGLGLVAFMFLKQRQLFGSLVSRSIVATLLTAPITLVLAYRCYSRGAWLALIMLGIVLAYAHIRKVERLLLTVFLGLAVTLAAFVVLARYPTLPAQKIMADIRLPMWVSTVNMIVDHDPILAGARGLFTGSNVAATANQRFDMALGVGPGQFAKAYAPYRVKSRYHDRTGVAAPVSIHPHNEFLNIAAQAGVLAAVTWLLLLAGLLRRNDPDDPRFNLGRPLALLIYFHSFFDMPLVQQPGNIVAMFALGLCWQRLLTVPVELPEKSIGFQCQRAAVSLAVIAGLLSATLIGIKSMRVSWHFRDARIEEINGRFDNAYEDYVAITRIDPDNVRAHLFAGVVALDRLENIERATPHLLKTHELDPNFAHINEKLGRVLAHRGDQELAREFYLRECELYPRRPAAFQRLLVSLAITNRFEQMLSLKPHLDGIYRQWIEQHYGRDEVRRLAVAWRRQMVMQKYVDAIATAQKLHEPIESAFIDPLFFPLTTGQEWQEELLRDGFNVADCHYWVQLFVCGARRQEAAAQFPDLSTVEQAFRHVHENLSIDPDAAGFLPPDLLWEKKKGSLFSIYALLAGMLEPSGFIVVLERDEDGTPGNIIAFDATDAWRADFAANEVKALETGRPEIEWRPGRTQLIVMPQEFFLKNQIIGHLIHQHTEVTQMDDFPTLRLVLAITWTSKKHIPFHLMAPFIAREPIDTLYEDIHEIVRPDAAPPTNPVVETGSGSGESSAP